MQKRKISASVIILFIAAATLVSGTYAWFVVGGFASLFQLNNNVIQSGAGLEIQGSAAGAAWKDTLEYADFAEGDMLKTDGTGFYTPVSLMNKGSVATSTAQFVRVGLNGDVFSAKEATKGTHYNDFSINLRYDTANPTSDEVEMKVKISGSVGDNGQVSPTKAGRVAVTVNGTTTVYALEDTSDNYVTQIFADDTITDTNGDRVITSADNGSGSAGLSSQTVVQLDENGNINGTDQGIIISSVPGNTSYTTVKVQTWLEGNDSDCVDLDGQSIESGAFVVDISFTSVE